MESHYYFENTQDGPCVVANAPAWSVAIYKFDPRGKGDLIFRTALFAIAKEDLTLLDTCINLLNKRKRWPDELCHKNDAANLFVEYLDRWITKYNRWASRTEKRPIIPWRKRYRSQGGMTRDPFIMAITAWYLLDGEGKCPIKIPWYIQRPDLYYWKKWIDKGKVKHKKAYERWVQRALVGVGEIPMFVLHLHCWKAWTIESTTIMRHLRDYVPSWNYACRLLIRHPLNYLMRDFHLTYRARSGYQWTEEKWILPPDNSFIYLDPEDYLKLDKDIVDYLLPKQDKQV